MVFNWQYDEWPNFSYNSADFTKQENAFNRKIGRFSGVMEGLATKDQLDTTISIMVAEAMKTSEVEGEFFSREDVFSSIKKNLGLTPTNPIKNQRAIGYQ